MAVDAKMYLDNITSWIEDDRSVVTYKRICRVLGADVNIAKQMLYEYFKAHEESVHACYYIVGDVSDKNERLASLVYQEDLEKACSKLSKIHSQHLFSVQPARPTAVTAVLGLDTDAEQDDASLAGLVSGIACTTSTVYKNTPSAAFTSAQDTYSDASMNTASVRAKLAKERRLGDTGTSGGPQHSAPSTSAPAPKRQQPTDATGGAKEQHKKAATKQQGAKTKQDGASKKKMMTSAASFFGPATTKKSASSSNTEDTKTKSNPPINTKETTKAVRRRNEEKHTDPVSDDDNSNDGGKRQEHAKKKKRFIVESDEDDDEGEDVGASSSSATGDNLASIKKGAAHAAATMDDGDDVSRVDIESESGAEKVKTDAMGGDDGDEDDVGPITLDDNDDDDLGPIDLGKEACNDEDMGAIPVHGQNEPKKETKDVKKTTFMKGGYMVTQFDHAKPKQQPTAPKLRPAQQTPVMPAPEPKPAAPAKRTAQSSGPDPKKAKHAAAKKKTARAGTKSVASFFAKK